ncbi:MAG: cytochrome c oxidase assembly protein [Pseudomonadota bacterium]
MSGPVEPQGEDRQENGSAGEARRSENGRLAAKLLTVSVAMFGFGVFVMPPLYETFCEITGLNQGGITIADAAPEQIDADRSIKVRFDATTNSALNWDFDPVELALDIPVGAPAEAFYVAENLEDSAVVGMATFNVSPPSAARYFVKVECFCFSQQVLESGERREMPVYFFVQPDLPADIQEMTLSYTFFKHENQDVAQNAR